MFPKLVPTRVLSYLCNKLVMNMINIYAPAGERLLNSLVC